MSRTIVLAADLKKEYDDSLPILNGITLNLESGLFYSVTGESGVGKSTLLYILGLLDKPTSGKILIKGEDISGMSKKKVAALRMKSMGFVFQSYHLNSHLNVIENIMLPMYINPSYDLNKMKLIANELLYEIGMEDKGKRFPSELSGGEQQRVAIARSISNNPEIIFADEPTGNLDASNEENIFGLFKKYVAKGKAVMVISHSDRILKYSDINFIMKNGLLERQTV